MVGWLAVSVIVMSMCLPDTAGAQTDPNRTTTRRSVPGTTPNPQGPQFSAELTRRLWQSRIAIPESREDADSRQDLKNLIRQVRSLKFEDNAVAPSFSAPTDVTPQAPAGGTRDAAKTPAVAIPPTPASSSAVKTGAPAQPVTSKRLEGLRQDADHVRNPLEVAELLFLSGHSLEAIPFYQRALAQTTRADVATSNDRAWILFQLGNCFRGTDMAKAKDAYQRLVNEHPDSPWTELAQAHGRLIAWYLSARPDRLLPTAQSQ